MIDEFCEKVSKEKVSIVDENNLIIGETSRKKVRRDNLLHRCTFIFVQNRANKNFLVQQRTLTKDYCPGYFDVAFGGVLQVGETYFQSAQRELEEEIGLDSGELKYCGEIFYQDEQTRCFGGVFLSCWDGNLKQLKLQKEEVERVFELSAKEIFARISEGEFFTPDSTAALRYFLSQANE